MKDYIEDVIFCKINVNINGSRVTYGEFLRWIGIWFLIAMVIGLPREAFFSLKPIDPFLGAPFRVNEYMSKKRFEKILAAIRYNDTAPPVYKDQFWVVCKLIDTWNLNMSEQFGPGWVNCLDESMSPWTSKYTCPGHVFLPRKPWPLGNEYHSICCCQSGVMFRVEIVEGKDCP